jgi:branched-chain amino acid transport system permease protein
MSAFRIPGAAALGVALLAALPLAATGAYFQHLLVLWLLYALMALSLNIIIGYLGELSFGHAAFFGLGAYASAMLAVYSGWPFWLSLVSAAVIAGIFGLVIGYVSLRIKGPQFAILTLGFGAILHSVFINWIDFTNGPLGITKIPAPRIPLLGYEIEGGLPYYYLVLIFLLLSAYLCRALMRSRTGRAFIAVRENDVLAASLGIDTFRYKLLGFIVATMMVGVAGSLYAHYIKVITPGLFTLHYMAPMVIMVIVGGKGTVTGPVIGALVYVVLLEVLRASGSMRMLVFAVLLTLSVIFLPGGLVSLLPKWRGQGGREKAND